MFGEIIFWKICLPRHRAVLWDDHVQAQLCCEGGGRLRIRSYLYPITILSAITSKADRLMTFYRQR
jgi:hypothetical protein